jgi:hypothetical protein
MRETEAGRSRQQPRTGQQQCHCHDGTTGEADSDSRLGEAVADHGGLNEISQARSPLSDVALVTYK